MPASTSAAGASPPPSEPAVLTHTRDAGGARLAMREPAQPPRKHFCLVLPGAADAALHVCLTLEDSRSTWVWVSWGRCGPFTGPCVCFRCFRGYLYSVYCTLAPVYPVLHPGASFNVGVGILGPLCLFSWLSAQCTARSVYVLHLGAWAATCRRSVLTPCFGRSDRYARLECLRCRCHRPLSYPSLSLFLSLSLSLSLSLTRKSGCSLLPPSVTRYTRLECLRCHA
jgi:hypothetical protein